MSRNETGAMTDYALGAALIVAVSFVPLYRYFQSQTKPFCQVLAPLSGVDGREANISWGGGEGNKANKVVCYQPVLVKVGKKTTLSQQVIFEAGYLVLEN